MGDSRKWSTYDDEQMERNQIKKATNDSSNEYKFNKLVFRNRFIFGGLVGGASGATFGIMQCLTTNNKNGLSKKSARSTLDTIGKTTGQYVAAFSAYFCLFQGVKYFMETQIEKDDWINTVTAGSVSYLPFIRINLMRRNVHYAFMLTILDYFHEDIRPNSAR